MIAPKKTEQPSWERFATKRMASYTAITLAVLAALVWALAFVGQGLGSEQMYALRRFIDESLSHDDEA